MFNMDNWGREKKGIVRYSDNIQNRWTLTFLKISPKFTKLNFEKCKNVLQKKNFVWENKYVCGFTLAIKG